MKIILTLILSLTISSIFSQEKNNKALQKSNNFIYEGNKLINDNFVAAEKEYRKAISEKPSNTNGAYNLGNAYYNTGNYDEALLRHIEATKLATTKAEKHQSYHNLGNTLMQQKQCKEAVAAFKNALRNDPTDEESRYNFVIAKQCAEQQQKNEDKNKKDKDKKDDKEKKEEEDKKDENKDEGDKDKKEGDDKKDEDGKPKDEKDDKKENNPKDKKKSPPQPRKLSPQQVKNLLEAMNNEEKKVQKKMNAKKTKGIRIKTEKDW